MSLAKTSTNLDQCGLTRVSQLVYGDGLYAYTSGCELWYARVTRVSGQPQVTVRNEDSGLEYYFGIEAGIKWITETCHPVWITPYSLDQDDSGQGWLFGSPHNVGPVHSRFSNLVYHFYNGGITISTIDGRHLHVFSLELGTLLYQDAKTREVVVFETEEPLIWITKSCHPILIHVYGSKDCTLYGLDEDGSDEVIPQND